LQGFAPHDRSLSRLRLFSGMLDVERQIGIKTRVPSLDTSYDSIHELDWRERPTAYHSGELGRWCKAEVSGIHHRTLTRGLHPCIFTGDGGESPRHL
jgi:hypothetical protein